MLALVALFLQFALSFGHIHSEDFATARPASVSVAIGTHAPAPFHGDHEDCPICVVMHLAGTLVLPAPPAIGLPYAADFALVDTAEGDHLAPALARPFHARAPPRA